MILVGCRKEETETVKSKQWFNIEVLDGRLRIEYTAGGYETVDFLEVGQKPVFNVDRMPREIKIECTGFCTFKAKGRFIHEWKQENNTHTYVEIP